MELWRPYFFAVAVTLLSLGIGTRLYAEPACCAVTGVNSRTGEVTAKENATGRIFEFRVTDASTLAGIRPGTPVYANFTAMQVSLDGRTACCAITQLSAIAGNRPAPPAPSPAQTTAQTPAPPPGSVQQDTLLVGRPIGKVARSPQMGSVIPARGCPTDSGVADLLISALGFDATRHVTYTVVNCGQAATPLPFNVDLYLKGTRGDTVEHPPLPARSQQTVTSSLAQYPGCDQVNLRASADPQQIIAESNESNNDKNVDLTPPCPDLAVEDIKQDWEDANTRYRVQIKVGNRGNGPSQIPVMMRAHVSNAIAGVPQLQDKEIPALAPGQSTVFHLDGKHALTSTVDVDLFVDFYRQLVEPNKDNNIAKKTLGPH